MIGVKRTASVLGFLAAAYTAAQILADVASARIVELWGWSVDAGTLVYPFTFTLRDLIHKVAGKRVARTLIFSAAGINLAMVGLFALAAALPADLAVGPQLEFEAVLVPLRRIVLASIAAEVISELVDTEVYQAWVRRLGDRRQWGRVLTSNAVAIPIDSGIFALLAFAGAVPAGSLWEIFIVNVVLKGLVTVLSIPWIYLVRPEPSQNPES